MSSAKQTTFELAGSPGASPSAGPPGGAAERAKLSKRQGTATPVGTMSAMLVESLLADEERPRRRFSLHRTLTSDLAMCPDLSVASAYKDDAGETDVEAATGSATESPARSAAASAHSATSSHLSPFSRAARRARRAQLRERLLDRDAPFGQSAGHWAISNMADSGAAVHQLFRLDWYHAFLDAKASTQMMVFALAFVTSWAIFALLFLLISKPCNLQLKGSFIRAYLLALESMVTIGYGMPDPYMNGCWQGAIVMTAATLLQLLMTALLVGIVFQGISRPQARACTILFSENAVIRCIDGAYYFMFRICDLRVRHSLIEAHVRCYCVHQDPVRGCEAVPMRLEHPDDDLNATLLLTMPYIVVHRIDAWSPLSPVPSREPAPPLSRACRAEHYRTSCWPGTIQRQVDCESGNRSSCVCPTCGASFGTAEMLQLHCRYEARSDDASGLAPEHRHRELGADELRALSHQDPTKEEIQLHLSQGFFEVVVLVEGMEPTTSATLQARHSYVVGNRSAKTVDVVWDQDFEGCVTSLSGGRGVAVDLGRFHRLVDPGSDGGAVP